MSIQTLFWWHGFILYNVWPDPEAGAVKDYSGALAGDPVAACSEVKNYLDANVNGQWKGMMAINIKDLTLDNSDWKARCHVTSSCGPTSDSKSKFYGKNGEKGDNIGLMNGANDVYYPEITDITP